MMKRDDKRRDPIALMMLFPLLMIVLTGCASPPAVTPVMRVVERALEDEAARIEAGATAESRRTEQVRRMLADAYLADLRARETLDVAWVEEATTVYVTAREGVLRNELAQQTALQQRAVNLRAAAEAQRRAIRLLERQDELIVGTLGIDFWEWLEPLSEARQ